jgi:hypothetical protein
VRDAFAARLTESGDLDWNVFLGGSDLDYGRGITLDGNDLYLIGSSLAGWGDPVRPYAGGEDAFVAKLNKLGQLQWHTFLGGSGTDYGISLTVYSNGLYLTGTSSASWGTPLRPFTGGKDAFAVRLNTQTGEFLWNTFLGGAGEDLGERIRVDSSGRVYVFGISDPSWAWSAIHTWTGLYDAFLTRLNTDGVWQDNHFYGVYGDEAGTGIAVDAGGNVYGAGTSFSAWGPPNNLHAGNFDVFVTKIAAGGSLLWHTFHGCGGDDYAAGLVLDQEGNIYLTGSSEASWGPSPKRAHSVSFQDAFVAKLNKDDGALVWNTFLGGGGITEGRGIAIDGSRNVYLTGTSFASWGIPPNAHAGQSDAFAAKLDSSGGLLWNTFLGGGLADEGRGIAVDSQGNPYVTGYSLTTWGSPVRDYTALADAFVAKLSTANGQRQWNTFLGDSNGDLGQAITVDTSGNCYVTGESDDTWGDPLRPFAGGIGVFAAKLNSLGTLLWNTFLGGSDLNEGRGIALAGNGALYLTGYSSRSWGNPLQPLSGPADAFAAGLSNDGALLWNTFLGGPAWDFGTAVAVDPNGNIYLTGYSGAGWGSPVRAFTGLQGFDVFAAKLDKFLNMYLPLILMQ